MLDKKQWKDDVYLWDYPNFYLLSLTQKLFNTSLDAPKSDVAVCCINTGDLPLKMRFADCRHSFSNAQLTSQWNCLGSYSTDWCHFPSSPIPPPLILTSPLGIWISPGDGLLSTSSQTEEFYCMAAPSPAPGPCLCYLGLQGCLSWLLQAAGSQDPTWGRKIPRSHKFPPANSQQTVHFFLALPQSVWSCFTFKSQQEPNLDPVEDISVQHISPLTLKSRRSFHYSPPWATLQGIQTAAVLMWRRPLTWGLTSHQEAFYWLGKAATTTSAPPQCYPPTTPQYQESTCTNF